MKSVSEVSENFFLIVGSGRSGTTLLKSMLDSHPSIHIPPETFFFTSIFKNSDFTMTADAVVKVMRKKWWIKRRVVCWESFKEKIDTADTNALDAAFFALLQEGVDDENIEVYGEKTPAHVNQSIRLLEQYDGGKIIHIIRDPRAIYSSYKNLVVGYQYPALFVKSWKRIFRIHEELKDHPRYLSIKYEDLVTTPKPVLDKVQAFLGVDQSDSVFEFNTRKNRNFEPEQKHHEATLRPISSDSLEKWRSLPDLEIKFIESSLYQEMVSLGYDCDPPQNPPTKYLKFYFSVMEVLHKNFVRRPHQLKKALSAKLNKRA